MRCAIQSNVHATQRNIHVCLCRTLLARSATGPSRQLTTEEQWASFSCMISPTRTPSMLCKTGENAQEQIYIPLISYFLSVWQCLRFPWQKLYSIFHLPSLDSNNDLEYLNSFCENYICWNRTECQGCSAVGFIPCTSPLGTLMSWLVWTCLATCVTYSSLLLILLLFNLPVLPHLIQMLSKSTWRVCT